MIRAAGPLRRAFGSATVRLGALVFLLQIVVAAAVLLYAQQSMITQVARDQQEFVDGLQQDMLAVHRAGGDVGLAAGISARVNSLSGENLLLLLTGADGRVLAGNIGAWPPVIAHSTRWQLIDLFRTGSDKVERIGVSAAVLPGGSHLLTGRVIETDLRLAEVGERVLAAAFLMALPLALLVAYVTARLIERRVAGIADTAGAVGAGDLARRVPLGGSGDAFDRLGQGINAMLERIETLVGELRVVTGSLAHDLRAPIFRITATLEQAVEQTGDPAAQAAMERVGTEVGVLQCMLATAMQIAQAEAGIGRNRFDDVAVGDMLTGLAELYEFAAEDQGIGIAVASDAGRFRLHRELVDQALGNLVDNALKYAAGATRISLLGAIVDDQLVLTVADNGVGIAPADVEQALRRFGRLDPSRHQNGVGLGLSLVEAVAKLHGGSVMLSNNDPGLQVVIRLQAVAEYSADGPMMLR